MSKAWKITIIIVSSILILFFAFISVYYFWPWNKTFFDNSTKEFEIPGLDTNFVPQGMTKIDGTEKYIISGYMSDNSPSRFYIIGEDGKMENFFTLKYDELDYCGHAGGILSKGSTVWVVGDKICYRLMLSDINNLSDSGTINAIDNFELSNGADFVFEYDSYLWIGEFYKKDKYETSRTHRLKTRSGEENPSLVYGYQIDESKKYGLYENSPSKILSIRGECQGISVAKDGKFVMSCSYGIKDSTLYYYKDVLKEERHGTFVLGKKMIDLWYLDNESLLNTVNMPSMSEEIVVNNDRIYILFESSAKKYKIFNRKQLKNVYSLPINWLEK